MTTGSVKQAEQKRICHEKEARFDCGGRSAAGLSDPLPFYLNDGGTVEYRALLYSVSKVHRLNGEGAETPYQEGTIVKLLGVEIGRAHV